MNLSLNDENPCNTTELSTYQEKGYFYIANDPALYMLFTVINIVQAISKDPIHNLFLMDKNGRALAANNRSIEQALTSRISIHDLADSNYTCEHLDIFTEAYQVAVAPYIHPEDEYSFWKAQPNCKFDILTSAHGLIKGSRSAALLKNNLINEICQLTDQPKFKIAQYERAKKAKHQYEQASKLVNSLKKSFSKLLVLRIDFCWKNQAASTIDEMKTYFSRFLKKFHHEKNLPNIVGYLWKLEFGQQKGYHYHCIFFMDGNKFQRDGYYAEVIGRYWSKLTLDKGFYYNCHRDKIKYRNLAIGMAHHDDQSFFNNLDQVLLYICKQDQFLISKRLLTPKLRVFGTSQRPSKAKMVGRPRKFKTIPTDTTLSSKLAVIAKNRSAFNHNQGIQK
ncbi:YagK/YfjJ domain-containing protein [Acinetobacter sp. ANC 3813]|uniref:YagK/YfjJ domain-containing protein n=1 Tax=Acinetobacter sp. ANC 3813 TaxID=1977873 RepID=UPI000A32D92D|nr:inovirus-type Gp2 protein [Acinetobacter sp. ANC 3813]OTG92183.1 hypothetical protein B9T34_02295 [Acinetobacter sp. ANC 3813]